MEEGLYDDGADEVEECRRRRQRRKSLVTLRINIPSEDFEHVDSSLTTTSRQRQQELKVRARVT